MTQSCRRCILVGGLAAVFVSTLPVAFAQAPVEGRTAQDRRFLTGGVGLDESERMKTLASDFSLTVLVAASSGAYLADTRLMIRDAQGKAVLDAQISSPYLLVDLAAGRYDVQATHQGVTQQRRINVAENSRAKVVFSFDVPVDRAPKSPSG
jgi:hypothetical protein